MNTVVFRSLEQAVGLRLLDTEKQGLDEIDIASFSLKQTFINSRECPYCKSHHVVGKGNYRGRKRYICRACGKSHNDLTNTPFSGVHNLDKVKEYLKCLMNGDSIRKAARIVNISIPTSFNWRHRLLEGLDLIPAPRMRNVREVKEIEVPYSHKGQRSELTELLKNSKISAIFVCDRIGIIDSDSISVLNRKNNPILQRIAKNSDTHTDFIGSPNFFNIKSNFSKTKNSHSPYYSTDLISNSIIFWQEWMKRFHGVASKYLSHYLHWFDYIDNAHLNDNMMLGFVRLLMKH